MNATFLIEKLEKELDAETWKDMQYFIVVLNGKPSKQATALISVYEYLKILASKEQCSPTT